MPCMTERIDIRLPEQIISDLTAIRKTLGLTSTSATVRYVIDQGIAGLMEKRSRIPWREIEHIQIDLRRIAGMLSRHQLGNECTMSILEQINDALQRLDRALN